MEFLAHIRTRRERSAGGRGDKDKQLLAVHLSETADEAGKNLKAMGLEKLGELVGLLHDFGKYSEQFQHYLQSATGLIDQDADEYIDPKYHKGKIDHSSAGAQYIWQQLGSGGNKLAQLVAQMAALCVASHHSGLIDVLKPDGVDNFRQRMDKPDQKTNLEEAKTQADPQILQRAEELLNDPQLLLGCKVVIQSINNNNPGDRSSQQFCQGLLTRMVFSALINADRTNSIDFEWPEKAAARQSGQYRSWPLLAERLEEKMKTFTIVSELDRLRAEISDHCLKAADRKQGVFTLSVPTGGGKTLSSLRFALKHADKHELEKVIFVLPFTTIIEQNAEEVRKILETSAGEKPHSIVLEHHSNLLPSEDEEDKKNHWRNLLLSENWDAPIVFTTSVQLQECLFARGTRAGRRMHQLANALIVFDEIQSLPVKMVHLFCNAMNFLVEQCQSSVVLCTATQPLLHQVDSDKGALRLSDRHEIMPDPDKLFAQLKRTVIEDRTRPEGWSNKAAAELALSHVNRYGSCLVVVNTKAAAMTIYTLCEQEGIATFHLSTNMCPQHRRRVLQDIRGWLAADKPVLCISTQLIEAGVNISFASAIRYLAGLDSIAQAAGRCNRHGERDMGVVSVINAAEEKLEYLPEIEKGQEITQRILDEFRKSPKKLDHDLLSPKAMTRYYEEYFFVRANEMSYSISGRKTSEQDDTLLRMLSSNNYALKKYRKIAKPQPHLQYQSFATAAGHFQAIDAHTRGVIVPYGDKGKEFISDLLAAPTLATQKEVLRQAQPCTVNIYPHTLRKLMDQEALYTPQGSDFLCLDEKYYSDEFGLCTEPVQPMDPMIC